MHLHIKCVHYLKGWRHRCRRHRCNLNLHIHVTNSRWNISPYRTWEMRRKWFYNKCDAIEIHWNDVDIRSKFNSSRTFPQVATFIEHSIHFIQPNNLFSFNVSFWMGNLSRKIESNLNGNRQFMASTIYSWQKPSREWRKKPYRM